MTARDDLVRLLGGLQRSDCCNICACGDFDRATLDCAACSAETESVIKAFEESAREIQREKDALLAEKEGLYDMAYRIRKAAS
jgi:hypothetical protein